MIPTILIGLQGREHRALVGEDKSCRGLRACCYRGILSVERADVVVGRAGREGERRQADCYKSLHFVFSWAVEMPVIGEHVSVFRRLLLGPHECVATSRENAVSL